MDVVSLVMRRLHGTTYGSVYPSLCRPGRSLAIISRLYWSTNALTLGDRDKRRIYLNNVLTHAAMDLNPMDLAGASGELELGAEEVAELGIGKAGGVRRSERTSERV